MSPSFLIAGFMRVLVFSGFYANVRYDSAVLVVSLIGFSLTLLLPYWLTMGKEILVTKYVQRVSRQAGHAGRSKAQ